MKTSVPCVLLIERIGEEYSVSVTDPTMNVHLKQVKVEIGDVAIDITLPSGKECGKCVTQRFSPAVEKRRASALNRKNWIAVCNGSSRRVSVCLFIGEFIHLWVVRGMERSMAGMVNIFNEWLVSR